MSDIDTSDLINANQDDEKVNDLPTAIQKVLMTLII